MFWRKKRPSSDFAQEIKSHLAHEADDLQQSDEQRTDAEAAARRAFGNVTLVQEAFYQRESWFLWDQLSRAFRHAGSDAGPQMEPSTNFRTSTFVMTFRACPAMIFMVVQLVRVQSAPSTITGPRESRVS